MNSEKRELPIGWWIVGGIVLVIVLCVCGVIVLGALGVSQAITTRTLLMTQEADALRAAGTRQARIETTATAQVEGTAQAKAYDLANILAEAPTPRVSEFDELYTPWPSVTGEDDYGKYSLSQEDGHYIWEMEPVQGVFYYRARLDIRDLENFAIAVDAEQLEGEDGNFALVFNHSVEGDYYIAAVNTVYRGYYVSAQIDQVWQDIIPYTDSSAVTGSGPQNLMVTHVDGHYEIFINNWFVDEFDDSTLEGGYLGLGVDIPAGVDRAVFQFDHFEYYDLSSD